MRCYPSDILIYNLYFSKQEILSVYGHGTFLLVCLENLLYWPAADLYTLLMILLKKTNRFLFLMYSYLSIFLCLLHLSLFFKQNALLFQYYKDITLHLLLKV